MVKLTHSESSQMFVMEDRSGRAANDVRRTSQAYPGSLFRGLWSVMQSSSTQNGDTIQGCVGAHTNSQRRKGDPGTFFRERDI